MSGTFAIARREFVERRVVIWASLAAAVLPFMSPLVPGIPSGQSTEARDILCLVLASAIGLGSTLLLGAGVFGRDLSEGRMGFDFSRPVGALSIWGGRFLGALGVVLAAVTVVALPTLLASRFAPASAGMRPMESLGIVAAATVVGVLCLLPLAHAASIALRSKSLWLGVDLVALLIAALTVGLIERSLINAWAQYVALGMAVALGVVAVLALWAASVAQVTVGRTDLRRGHRAQSICLWSLSFLALLISSGYVVWMLRAGPRDLVEFDVNPAPNGDWVGVNGPGRGRFDFRAALLVNARDGRVIRLGGTPPWTSALEFSDDGRRAVWIHCSPKRSVPCDVTTIDLQAQDPAVRRSNVVVPTAFGMWPVVSPDGRRMAIFDDWILSIHDVDSGRVEASVRLNRDRPSAYPPRARFAADGKLRVYFTQPRLEIFEFDPATRQLVKTGDGPELESYAIRGFSPDGERMVVRQTEPKANLVIDARTAAVLATYPRTPKSGTMISFLHDGRIVMAERQSNGGNLRLLSRDGAVEREFPMDRGDLWSFGGEPENGKLVLSFGKADPTEQVAPKPAACDSYLLDLATGSMRELAKHRAPVMIWEAQRSVPGEGSLAGRLFYDGGALVRIDPRSAAETVIAGRVESR